MTGDDVWTVLVASIAAPFVLYWITDGIVSRVKAHRARKEKVATRERDADRDHVRNLEAALARESDRANTEARIRRVIEDYAHQMRGEWIEAECTGPPPRWPDRLT